MSEHLLSKAVCVFPTEVARRSHLIDFALKSEEGVIARDAAISYDTFRAYFLPHYPDKVPSNTVIRTIFATEFVEEGNDLSSFYNPAYPESKAQVALTIAALLPALPQVITKDSGSFLPENLFRQFHTIYASYTEFLTEHALFEPSYEAVTIPHDWDHTQEYRILYSDTIGEAEELYKALGSPSWLTLIPTPSVKEPSIEVYANHLQEIRSTLRSIRRLLEGGVKTAEIMICLANSDELLATLEDEARFYGIPLVSYQGKSVLDYPAGRFFSLLRETYSDHFSLMSLKNLLLEPAVPWKDHSVIERFIETSLDRSILYGSPTRPDYFEQRLPSAELKKWYTTFRGAITAIVEAPSINELLRALSFFRDTFWTEEQWHETPQQEVFAHAITQLATIDSAMQVCGKKDIPSLYSLFLTHLRNTLYVPQQHSDGIGVYRWPQGSSVASEYRFFLGLDQESSEVIENPLTFLPERIQSALGERRDLTRAHIMAATQSKSTLSAHQRSNSGEKLLHFIFLEEGVVNYHSESQFLDEDPLGGEIQRALGEGGNQIPTALQNQSFERARRSSLVERAVNHATKPINEALRSQLYQEGSGQLLLSATGIDRFAKCPYTYLASYLYHLDPFDYTEAVIDHRTIGNLLHDAYESFFRDIGSFERAQVEVYRTKLQAAFDEALKKIYGETGPSASIRQWIIYSYRTLILSILSEELRFFENLRSTEFEKTLSFERDGVTLRGRIDRMIELGEGSWAVVDFKKGGAVTPITKDNTINSYQLLTYQALVEESGMGKAEVVAYYSVKDGKYKFLYKAEEAERQEFCRIALENVLGAIKLAVQEGTFEATPSDSACRNCPLRALCRRRYSTQ
ncbi:MAG: PD-(D/E)XK nuclease family protein [Sphaerochaeta sp.]